MRWTYWDSTPEIVLQRDVLSMCHLSSMCHALSDAVEMYLFVSACVCSLRLQTSPTLSNMRIWGIRASKQHPDHDYHDYHDHHDRHMMRKHQRRLWVSSSQRPGEIRETVENCRRFQERARFKIDLFVIGSSWVFTTEENDRTSDCNITNLLEKI